MFHGSPNLWSVPEISNWFGSLALVGLVGFSRSGLSGRLDIHLRIVHGCADSPPHSARMCRGILPPQSFYAILQASWRSATFVEERTTTYIVLRIMTKQKQSKNSNPHPQPLRHTDPHSNPSSPVSICFNGWYFQMLSTAFQASESVPQPFGSKC